MSANTLLRLGGIAPKSKAARAISAGLAQDPVAPDAFDALVEIAAQFLVAGGMLTAREWAGLEPIERAACVTAGVRLRAREARRAAYLSAMAAASPDATAAMAAEFDGGEAAEGVAVERAIDAAEKKALAIVQRAAG